MTPEGRIKAQVKRLLDRYKPMDTFWPVPNGIGASHLDFIGCYHGVYISVETKAPGKKPTPRQKWRIESVERAGGIALVIDGVEGLKQLECVLDTIKIQRTQLDANTHSIRFEANVRNTAE